MKRPLVWIMGMVSSLALVGAAFSLATVHTYSYSLMPDCMVSPTLNGCELIVGPPASDLPVRYAGALLALALVTGLPVWLALARRGERASASPRTLAMLSALLSTGALVAVAFILLSQGSVLSTPSVCYTGTGASMACYSGARGYLLALAGAGGPSVAAALVLGAPAWVMTLARAARLRQWRWFFAALLFSPVAPLLYSAFGLGPRRDASSHPAAPTIPMPVAR